MIASTPCPDLNIYRRLTAGQLAVAEAESLLRHLETCEVCAGKIQSLPTSDPLSEWVRQAKSSTPSPDEKQLAPLMQRLIQLGKTAGMVTFSCTACRKPLRVKGEAAGKKVKCPHCGQVLLAAAATPSVLAETIETAVLPPASSSVTATLANLPLSSRERELYAFLSPSQAPDEIGRLGSYRVLKVLGAGGMGVVFRAEDPQLQRIVALKAMLPALAANDAARQRFFREARLAASLKHDHVVTIHQVGDDRGAPYLAMEFLEGESLEDRLKREDKLPLPEVLRIGREIAEGLQAAHEHGLIHRDIKPANIWLEARSIPLSPLGRGVGGEGFRVKILDFGLARSSGDDVHLTQSGAIVGTPAYMPPEQARGESVDARCDLYSLGCVLYRLCTGELPFQGENAMSLLLALAIEQPKSPRQINPDVPPALAELILRLLAKKPADRPATAREVADALQGNASAKSPARPRWRRKLLTAAAVGAFLLAGMLAIMVIVRNKQGDEIARINVPEGGSIEIQNKEGSQNLSKHQGGRHDLDAAKIPPPVQIPEPPPLEEWLKSRKILTVSQDGKSQFKTIQAALDALKPHEVVKVLDRGPYRETLRLEAVPEDTGLISEQNTIVELPKWESEKWPDADVGHNFEAIDGFRLSGFRFLAPPPKRYSYVTRWNACPSDLVIEDCCFDPQEILAPWPLAQSILVRFEGPHLIKAPVVVRRCAIYSGSLALGGNNSKAVILVENNYFHKTATLTCDSNQLQKLIIRDNVFDDLGPHFGDLHGDATTLEMSNNTTVGLGAQCLKGVPTGGVTVCNNILKVGFAFNPKGGAVRHQQAARDWRIGHNCYLEYGTNQEAVVPKTATDLVDQAEFLSLDPKAPDYLRLPSDSPLGKAGAGGAWPSYIGALPPGPASKDGDWFTRLRQRWGKLSTSEPLSPALPPLDPDWFKQVAAMPAEKQVEAVVAKLKERNPGFDGKETHTIDKSVVVALRGLSGRIKDISPLRALTDLRVLTCHDAPLSDLSPLKGMPLTYLDCYHTNVADLSPLKGMPLELLIISSTKVFDLSPLKGMPLTRLECWGTQVSDLSPLKGMPLTFLDCNGAPVSDLSPLKDMKLTLLKGNDTKVSDLSPLKGMPLKELWCDFKPERDAAILRSIKTLEEINGKPAAELWKEVDAKAANKKP